MNFYSFKSLEAFSCFFMFGVVTLAASVLFLHKTYCCKLFAFGFSISAVSAVPGGMVTLLDELVGADSHLN